MAESKHTMHDQDVIPSKIAIQDLHIRCLREYDTGEYLEVYLDFSSGEGMNKVQRRLPVCNMFYNTRTKSISVKYSIDDTFDWSEFYDYYLKKGRNIERDPLQSMKLRKN